MNSSKQSTHGGEDVTPIAALIKNIKVARERLVHDGHDNGELIVLVSTGSLNPVHRMHIENFRLAKTELESNPGRVVVGGYLIPSHDSYVKSKLGMEAIPWEHRAAMCEIGIKEAGLEDWLAVSRWEALQRHFYDFDQVTLEISKHLHSSIPPHLIVSGPQLRVMYMCGADHALRCSLYGLKGLGVVVIHRPGISAHSLHMEMDRKYRGFKLSYIFVASDIPEGDSVRAASSTALRKMVQRRDLAALSALTYTSVAQYWLSMRQD